ncbi:MULTISPECIES: IspD/TarI family cytidylyltransferase [Oceanotoga]|jgi:2-C-methyl-D-erythritol 4-phosphate cytidylyltransferase|uniref:2-C-methyl-D-erythritol 4-phosphate cytidylyltransferase n=1 Tax=Oceanotoga teriensis TaxID=515440 RepID=A0AA45C9B4_9BACT|nr:MULTISPECIES: IspD/TarI family cytidylyltransferase [Oceanotoga]MDN5343682.1 2-C-methyl-D-erythritol 4-phosphate cytidylyltransferase [Oceanotoga sp.]MDO7975288.1 2-C-methyl-D-erythritol 4-phosphate cytidylyltransferase [Oceanotoga teriensis]PWJ96620.1 2-C-methyl-D-erythritol 4-phosphate cytidylyltransferase [Oceanotoga teriensis]
MNYAIIVSGGIGKRSGLNIPKQFYKIRNKTILETTIEKFENSNIDKILIVSNIDYINKTKEITKKFKKVNTVIAGGNSRAESVFEGLKYLQNKNIDIICIHDVVRPFIQSEDINKYLIESKNHDAIIPAIQEIDTISLTDSNGNIIKFLERSKVFRHLTPQFFNYEKLFISYKKNIKNIKKFTDDASIYFEEYKNIKIIPGNKENIKLTNPEDFK